MYKYKNLWFGLIIAVSAIGIFFTISGTALADPVNQGNFRNAQYRITQLQNNRPRTIVVTIAGEQFTFTDSNTSDTNMNLKTSFAAVSSTFICGQGREEEGITLQGFRTEDGIRIYSGHIRLGYKDDTEEDCANGDRDEFLNNVPITARYDPNAQGGGEDEEGRDACYATGWAGAWIACPLIKAGEEAAQTLYALVTDLLSFRVPEDIQSPTGENDVREAWSIFRTMVSAIVVILMLVMVISQAIGRGIFEAYTIQKMLPRIAIAVILIQISWPLFSWIVNVVDDIGHGLANLIYAPFGGADDLSLNRILGAYGLGGEAALFSWTAFIGLIVAGALALPLILSALFVAVLAIIVALATLIFRNILITLFLITVPIALILWVIPSPGIQRYWKLWWDNFIKVLLMYPLIVLLIAAGQIFAFVGGGQSVGIIGFFIILVGFFGPYFLLPKTFKWGGSIMQTAGQGMTRASTALAARPKKYFQARQQEWTEQRRRTSAQRVAKGEGFDKNKPWQYPLDQLRSGKWDPLKQVPGYRAIGERSEQEYIRAGEEIRQKDIEAARQKILSEGQRFRARGRDWDQYFQMRGEGARSYVDENTGEKIELDETSELEQEAARKQTAILGSSLNWRYLESKFEQMEEMSNPKSEKFNPDEALKLRKFFDDNVQQIMPKMPHVYIGLGSAAESNASTIAQMHGVGVEAVISKLSNRIREASEDERSAVAENDEEKRKEAVAVRAGAERQLVTFLQNFQEAAENENITVDNTALRAVKGFMDSTEGAGFRKNINLAPAKGKTSTRYGREPMKIIPLPDAGTLELSTQTRNELNRIKAEVSDKIDSETGSYTGGANAAPAGEEGELKVDHGPTPPPPPPEEPPRTT